MKKSLLFSLVVIFCLISNVAYSAPIDLDEASKAKLIRQIKRENVTEGRWADNASVTLEEFYKVQDNNDSNAKYFVRAVGTYPCPAIVEYPSGAIDVIFPVPLSKRVSGYFSKEELESWGIQLPK